MTPPGAARGPRAGRRQIRRTRATPGSSTAHAGNLQTFTQLDPGVASYSVQVFDGAGVCAERRNGGFPNSTGPQQPRGNYGAR